MSKTKTKLKNEVETLASIIENKNEALRYYHKLAWNLQEENAKLYKSNQILFWTGFSLGFIVNILFVAALAWVFRG